MAIKKTKRVTTLKRVHDSQYMKEIGRRGGLKTKKRKGKKYFSDLAKKSHGPGSARDGYHGGRPAASK